MSNVTQQSAPHDRLIQGLASDLRPVKPLPPAGRRALIWLGFVVAAGLLLSLIADLPAFAHRFMASPDMWMAMTGSALTAVLAAVAAFKLSMPDSPRAWKPEHSAPDAEFAGGIAADTCKHGTGRPS